MLFGKNKIVFLLFLIIPLFFSCRRPASGTGSVSGCITCQETGVRLPGVSVTYGDSSVYTAENGTYIYEMLPEGFQGLVFRKNGYHPLVRQVLVLKNAEVTCDVSMRLLLTGWAAGDIDSGYGVVLHTEDGGAVWQRQGSPAMIPESSLHHVCAIDSNSCWIVGDIDRFRRVPVILRTDDGGDTWVNQGAAFRAHAPVSLSSICSYGPDRGWTVSSEVPLILRTSNAGKSWEVCGSDLPFSGFSDIATPDGIHIWCSGKDPEGCPALAFSSDGGDNWEALPLQDVTAEQSAEALAVYSPDLLYLCGSMGFGVRRSVDRGRSWQNIPMFGAEKGVNDIFIYDPDRIWTADAVGNLFYSSDALQTYSDQLNGKYQGFSVLSLSILADGLHGAVILTDPVTREGKILYTLDGGENWTGSSSPYDFTMNHIGFSDVR